MLKPSAQQLAQLIISKIRDLAEDGELSDVKPNEELGYTCESVFGFHPTEVQGIHTHKIGVGDGVWFRLKDGRVISGLRGESDQNPVLYDTVQN
jgi:hypothetical protein